MRIARQIDDVAAKAPSVSLSWLSVTASTTAITTTTRIQNDEVRCLSCAKILFGSLFILIHDDDRFRNTNATMYVGCYKDQQDKTLKNHGAI